MDRCHEIHCVEQSTDIHGPWEGEIDEKTNNLSPRQCVARYIEIYVRCSEEESQKTTSRPDNVWPDTWKHMCDASKRKEKQKWAIEKPKLDNARRLRGIFFIEPDDEELRRIMKNARRKLEIPMRAAMPCRLQLNQHREACGNVGQHKTKYACIVEANESMHEDTSQEKAWILLSHNNLVHNFSYASSNEKYRMRKQQWRKNGKNKRTYRHGNWRMSETNQRWSMKQGRRA